MKKTKTHIFFGFTLLFGVMTGCQIKKQERLENPVKSSVAELETIIGNEVERFYKAYRKFDYDWIDFFEDEFINVFPDTQRLFNYQKDGIFNPSADGY